MGKQSLKLDKTVISSVDEAFDAFTDPTHISRWFTTDAKAELTVGGEYSNSDGDKGVFLAIERPQLVKFTWDNKDHCPGTVVEVRFETEAEGEVNIYLEHSGLLTPDHVRDMETGWNWALESLKSYLETGKPILFEDWQKKHPKSD